MLKSWDPDEEEQLQKRSVVEGSMEKDDLPLARDIVPALFRLTQGGPPEARANESEKVKKKNCSHQAEIDAKRAVQRRKMFVAIEKKVKSEGEENPRREKVAKGGTSGPPKKKQGLAGRGGKFLRLDDEEIVQGSKLRATFGVPQKRELRGGGGTTEGSWGSEERARRRWETQERGKRMLCRARRTAVWKVVKTESWLLRTRRTRGIRAKSVERASVGTTAVGPAQS